MVILKSIISKKNQKIHENFGEILSKLDWTRGACRPLEERFLIEKPAKFARHRYISKLLWGPPEHADIFCSKIEKVTKKVGPGKQLHRRVKAQSCGTPFWALWK